MLQILEKIRDYFVSDFDATDHDPICFDCNDGNEECVKYPNCRHILKKIESYKGMGMSLEALGIKNPPKEEV